MNEPIDASTKEDEIKRTKNLTATGARTAVRRRGMDPLAAEGVDRLASRDQAGLF